MRGDKSGMCWECSLPGMANGVLSLIRLMNLIQSGGHSSAGNHHAAVNERDLPGTVTVSADRMKVA